MIQVNVQSVIETFKMGINKFNKKGAKIMFCPNCGNEVATNEQFCGKCGTSCSRNEAKELMSKKSKKKFMILAVFVVVAIVLVGIIVGAIFANNKRDIEDVAKAIVDAEFGCTSISVMEKYAEILPENYLDYLVEEGEGWLWDDKEEWIEVQFEEHSDDTEEYQSQYGEDYEYSFKIAEEKEYDEDELDDYADECSEYDINPEAAKDITIKVRVTGNGDGMDYWLDVTMIQLDGSWYLLGI